MTSRRIQKKEKVPSSGFKDGGHVDKWMQKAVPEKNKGKFTRKAEKAGMSVHEYAEREKHAGGTLGREANLALTFEKHAHKH